MIDVTTFYQSPILIFSIFEQYIFSNKQFMDLGTLILENPYVSYLGSHVGPDMDAYSLNDFKFTTIM